MKLIRLSEQDFIKYQSFVEANGSFLQDWNWGEFQKTLQKEIERFFVVDDGGEILLSAQVIIHETFKKKYAFVPYGPVVGEKNKGKFYEAMHFFAKELGKQLPDLIFIRIEPQFGLPEEDAKKLKRTFRKSVDLDPHKTLVLNLLRSEDELLAQMHPKTRYNIKVAQRHEVVVNSQTEMQGCGVLFIETAKRAGIRAFNLDYYEKLLKYFCDGKTIKAKIYTAWHENDLLAINLLVYYRDTAIYLFGGSSDIKRNLMAPYLLHWEGIKFAKEDNYTKYDFWGIESDPNHPWYGFSRFKLGFGGETKEYAGTYDYVLKPAWYNIYTTLRKLNRRLRK